MANCHWDDLGGECIPEPTVEEIEEVDENDVDEDSNTIIEVFYVFMLVIIFKMAFLLLVFF